MTDEEFGWDNLPYRQEKQMQKEMEREEHIPLFLVYKCIILPVSYMSRYQVSEVRA
jgi:hypothetical protein